MLTKLWSWLGGIPGKMLLLEPREAGLGSGWEEMQKHGKSPSFCHLPGDSWLLVLERKWGKKYIFIRICSRRGPQIASGLVVQTNKMRATGLGLTAVHGTLPDGGWGVIIRHQTTHSILMAAAKTVWYSTAKEPQTLIGTMLRATLERESLFVPKRSAQVQSQSNFYSL